MAPEAPAGSAADPAVRPPATTWRSAWQAWRISVRRILPLAWPVMVGQIAVLAFSTLDTVLVARHSAADLAALAIGSAAYITVFVGLMGVIMAIAPIAGRHYGAGQLDLAGDQLHQAVWLALALALPGCALLSWPEPFLRLAQAPPEVAAKVSAYLLGLAVALPGSLLFTAFRGFNTAISQPRRAMSLQLLGLGLKLPLSTALVIGVTLPGLPAALNIPSLGVVGCGIATAAAMWLQAGLAWRALRHDPLYARFGLQQGGLHAPRRAALLAQLRLGAPMGLAILVEVTGFTFMAIFIARLGNTAVAGHQISANLVALLFMASLGIANATGALVAQDIGAGQPARARALGWHGVALACVVAVLLGGAVTLARVQVVSLYTADAKIAAAALPLLVWALLFHTADAAQTVAAFVLRAWHLATWPLIVYALAVWGLGLGGGYALAFDVGGHIPPALHGARGFWIATTAGLIAAALAMAVLLAWAPRRQTASQAAAASPAASPDA
jgi:MATE family multidrug resistance protein